VKHQRRGFKRQQRGVDEVGYIPFDPEAANLILSLVSTRYERASVIVTSNKPFGSWGEISAARSSPRR
jgi:DNA replication protein DnaC